MIRLNKFRTNSTPICLIYCQTIYLKLITSHLFANDQITTNEIDDEQSTYELIPSILPSNNSEKIRSRMIHRRMNHEPENHLSKYQHRRITRSKNDSNAFEHSIHQFSSPKQKPKSQIVRFLKN